MNRYYQYIFSKFYQKHYLQKIIIVMNHSLIFFFAPIFVVGCMFFSTRDSEPPNSQRSSFVPPSSPQIVISNLSNALSEKNTENYIQCLLVADASPGRWFSFEPSAEAAARFAGVFAGWTTARERQVCLAMFARVLPTAKPALTLSNNRFEVLLPDSAVYVADYTLLPNYDVAGAPKEFSGKMRLTLVALNNGFWAISRWSDQQLENAQANSNTWSILKAQFAN